VPPAIARPNSRARVLVAAELLVREAQVDVEDALVAGVLASGRARQDRLEQGGGAARSRDAARRS
jgi:hypothetical protein